VNDESLKGSRETCEYTAMNTKISCSCGTKIYPDIINSRRGKHRKVCEYVFLQRGLRLNGGTLKCTRMEARLLDSYQSLFC
jgi:hypothetical protein